ncbi:MAG: aminoacyl-tRNA deacylase [Alphaproteobacteria bacterium]|nr:aminoacyl-tRNA deacylase [Alphaproteobacteria bacterium]
MEYKTNVMRILDAYKIFYKHFSYDVNPAMTGVDIAHVQNQNPDMVFKTLLTMARPGHYYVFLIPVARELDLKRAAVAVNAKALSMVHQRDLLGICGYVHGGCSPIGMKKLFPTVVDSSAKNFETIIFSAGRPGHQVQLAPSDLQKIVPFVFADISE